MLGREGSSDEDAAASGICDAVRRIEPKAVVESLTTMYGSYSNLTQLVRYRTPNHDSANQVVLRRYNPAGGDPKQKACLEFHALAWLHNHHLPVARPLLLDADGDLLGSPGFLMTFMPGRQLMWPDIAPLNSNAYAREMAEMLAMIHGVPGEPFPEFFLNQNDTALWFRRRGVIPDYLLQHPDGQAIWDAIGSHLPDFHRTDTVLIHGDFWGGNVLWENGVICGVLDWEEVGCGDAGIDVAYQLMELALVGEEEAAETFLQIYEAAVGKKVANLAFWKLAVAVRPIKRPDDWIDSSPFQERFRRFVRTALDTLEREG
jgi:aminoglycoside phosphotransferase (APT) family kinase protein